MGVREYLSYDAQPAERYKQAAPAGKLDKEDEITEQNKKSFGNGYDTMVLKKGMILHRFIDGVGAPAFSDCWVDDPTFVVIMREMEMGIDQIERGNKDRKTDIRNQLALLRKWTSINRRVKVVLEADVIAHVGEIGPQKLFIACKDVPFAHGKAAKSASKLVEVRKGGHIQYVIPRFKTAPQNEEGNGLAKVKVNQEVFKRRKLK